MACRLRRWVCRDNATGNTRNNFNIDTTKFDYCKVPLTLFMLIQAGSGLWSVCGAVIEAVGLPALIEGTMAVPRGSKPNKNGRKVYSQTANAIKKRRQLGLGEFADDAAADITGSPPPLETSPESVSAPGEFSNEPIGVTSTATLLSSSGVPLAEYVGDPPADEDQDIYYCTNCHKKPIEIGIPNCPVCEEPLNWSGLT
jgi:hypothetical protein